MTRATTLPRTIDRPFGPLVGRRALAGLALALALGLCGSALAQGDLAVHYETDPGGYKLTARMLGGQGKAFGLVASVGGDAFQAAGAQLLGIAPLDASGDGHLAFVFDANLLPLPDSSGVHFAALTAHQGELIVSEPADLVLGADKHCEGLSFDHTIGPDDETVMVAGRIIDEQWADVGLHISADAWTAGLPDQAILFDTDDPTGGDFDLGVGLGHALIIDEDGFDGDGDGLVDDPDDAMFGGSLIFTFDQPATICSVTLIDVDETPGTELRFHRQIDQAGNAGSTSVIDVVSLGDGSVQTLHFVEEQVDRFEIFLRGSGAVAGMDLVLCPRVIDFDESTLGQPLGFLAGQWITSEFFGPLGVQIEAVNSQPTQGALHPDKAILFDTANPTGGDDDLATPNPDNPTNNEALGMVFIIAEDDWDGDGDGLVDDPDDEGKGGEIRFAFDADVIFASAKVLDCDENELDVFRFYDADGEEITSIVIPDAADGSVQDVVAGVPGVRLAVLELGGSGAVSHVTFCPDPGDSPKSPGD